MSCKRNSVMSSVGLFCGHQPRGVTRRVAMGGTAATTVRRSDSWISMQVKYYKVLFHSRTLSDWGEKMLILSSCVQGNVVTKFICFQDQVTINGPDSREKTLLSQRSSCKYISPSAPDCSPRLSECFMGPLDITCSQADGHSVHC